MARKSVRHWRDGQWHGQTWAEAAAEGEGAFAVTQGMPVQLPSGERLGTVRDILTTRAGEVRQLVVQTRDGLATIPSGSLSGSGSVLIAAEGSASGAASGE